MRDNLLPTSIIMTLTALEFQQRFFLHVLPKGFVRIRHFGFLANRFTRAYKAQAVEVSTLFR
jgi:hypothetical protein